MLCGEFMGRTYMLHSHNAGELFVLGFNWTRKLLIWGNRERPEHNVCFKKVTAWQEYAGKQKITSACDSEGCGQSVKMGIDLLPEHKHVSKVIHDATKRCRNLHARYYNISNIPNVCTKAPISVTRVTSTRRPSMCRV
jgi:hypothetical protein